jgi:hypothetical protein
MSETYLVEDCIQLLRNNSRPGYIPPHLPGSDFVEHFNLRQADIDHFFNLMCYELQVLSINPQMDESSYNWEENDFGLLEPFKTQLEREEKLKELGI